MTRSRVDELRENGGPVRLWRRFGPFECRPSVSWRSARCLFNKIRDLKTGWRSSGHNKHSVWYEGLKLYVIEQFGASPRCRFGRLGSQEVWVFSTSREPLVNPDAPS